MWIGDMHYEARPQYDARQTRFANEPALANVHSAEDERENDRREELIRHVIRRIPIEVINALPAPMVISLAEAMLPQVADHIIDYRASSSLFGKGIYLRLMIGKERRSRERLLAEKQIGLTKLLALFAICGWIATTSIILIVVVLSYLIKSELGIDLMKDDWSFLHELFYE